MSSHRKFKKRLKASTPVCLLAVIASSCHGGLTWTCSKQWFLTLNGFFFCPRLDYSGIALLIMGSFVPWLYYSFYCNPQPCFIYLIVICVLGIAAIIVSQWDMFATPQYRGVRAGKSTWRFYIEQLFIYQSFTKGLPLSKHYAVYSWCRDE